MAASDTTLSRIIGAIGEPDFAAHTAAALCLFTGFDLAALVVHRGPRHAELLFDNFERVGARRGIETYVRATRHINPMVPAGQELRAVRARDFAARGERLVRHAEIMPASDEELGYRTIGWPERQEEIALHVPIGAATIEIGLYRDRGRTPAPATMLDALAAMGGPVAAAFERNDCLCRPRTTRADDELTPREAQVRDLLLFGCSTEAIALRLSISRHTVKDHRKAIFRKFGISALAELFALSHPTPSSGGFGPRPS